MCIDVSAIFIYTFCLRPDAKGSTIRFYPFRSYYAFTGVTVCIFARYPLDTFVNGLQHFDFSPHCHSCYKASAFTLMGLSPIGYVQLRWTYSTPRAFLSGHGYTALDLDFNTYRIYHIVGL